MNSLLLIHGNIESLKDLEPLVYKEQKQITSKQINMKDNVIKKLTAKFGISYNKSIAAKQKYGVWVRLLSILSRKKASEHVSHEDSNT